MTAFALTMDQRASRRGDDRVPEALEHLNRTLGRALDLRFERTAGDEVQALTRYPGAVVRASVECARLGGWRMGIGLGRVELPLPTSTRAARGGAYLGARTAIDQARRTTAGLSLVAADARGRTVTGPGYGDAIRQAETALWLVHELAARRSPQGWEIVDMLDEGLSAAEAADELGISPSAVSQRLKLAHRIEVQRGAELCTRLLAEALQYAQEAAR